MSKNNSGNGTSKNNAEVINLPFSVGKILAIAPAVIIALIMGGVYFSGIIQLMLGNKELKEAGHEAKAIEYFNWALSANPNLAQAYSQRATALMEIEATKGSSADYSAARRDIANAVRLDPKSADYLDTSLKIEHAEHKFDKEIAGYEHLIELTSFLRPTLLNNRAGLYYTVGNFKKERADRDSTIKYYSSALTGKPADDHFNQTERAEQYRFLGEIDKAIRDYEASVKVQPTTYDLMHLAYLYESSGRPSQALKIYSKIIELTANLKKGEPSFDSDNAHYRRALLYLTSRDNAKALADADKLVKDDEECVHAQIFRARILALMNRNSEAVKQRKAALDSMTDDVNTIEGQPDKELKASAYASRADYYATMQQWKNALKDQLIAISLDPSASNYSDCARIYMNLGNYDKAIELYAKVNAPTANDDDLVKAYKGLAEIHLRQNKPELAVQDCQKAIMRGTRDAEASYLRAKAYHALGKPDLEKIDANEAVGLEFSPVPDL